MKLFHAKSSTMLPYIVGRIIDIQTQEVLSMTNNTYNLPLGTIYHVATVEKMSKRSR